MGLVTTGHLSGMKGIGNTSKPNVRSLSGVSADGVDIYNYNQVSLHLNTNGGKPAPSNILVLENKGCMYNGMPMWTFEDGFFDGDFDISWVSHRGHHHTKHVDDRHGSAICQGQSHQLRYGGNGSTGSWEIVTHGRVSAWTSATTKNFFGIQGTGNTETGVLNSTAAGALGTWQMVSATTTINGVEYGTWNHTTGTTRLVASMASISATTAFGVIL
jgi:hypothetical protein